jgi:hypothetical protein
MYLITLLKSGVRLLVEILITACKLMSAKEHLYLLLLIFKQEKDFSVAHGKEISVQGGFFCLGVSHVARWPPFAHPCTSVS